MTKTFNGTHITMVVSLFLVGLFVNIFLGRIVVPEEAVRELVAGTIGFIGGALGIRRPGDKSP